MGHVPTATPEQRAKGQATRATNIARLRKNFLDMPAWEQMASDAGLKLPPLGVPCTTGWMRRWLGRVGVTVPSYLDWAAERTLSSFQRNNPDWPVRAWAGLVLEHRDQMGVQP